MHREVQGLFDNAKAQSASGKAMKAVFDALAKAFGQLTDAAVLRVFAKSIALTLLIFVAFGALLWWALDAAVNTWLVDHLPADYAATLAGFAALALGLLPFWFLFRVVALAVLQFFADEIVAAVEAKHYPVKAEQARALPFREDLANSLRGAARALGANLLALPVALVLLVTGVGPALVFLAVNAWLLGRELTDMAWLRHREGQDANPVPKRQRLILGGAVAALMAVPFANLFAPVLGAAAGTHLAHRWIARDGDAV